MGLGRGLAGSHKTISSSAIYIYILSQEICAHVMATEETGLKLNIHIAKHMLPEVDTKLKSALIN